MAKFKALKGGGVVEIDEPQSEGESAVILDRFRPVMDAIKSDWEPFPEIDPGMIPTPAPWVLVQKRLPRKKVGSIITAGETQEVDGWRERIGKLLAVGEGCFKDVNGSPAFGVETGWPKVGDLVLIPNAGGTEFTRKSKSGDDVKITMFHWRDLMGVVTDAAI